MQKILTILLITGLLHACKSENRNQVSNSKTQPDIEVGAGDTPFTDTTARDMIQPLSERGLFPTRLPIRNLPLTDSTNFDNYRSSGISAEKFLKRTGFKPDQPETKDFRLRYRIKISEIISAVAITYKSGEHELFTTLLTIDNDNRIIDNLEIAYDEIAESAFRKVSTIQQNKIVVTSINFMGDSPIYESNTYILQKNGKFTAQKTSP